jgi:hypothetical protein
MKGKIIIAKNYERMIKTFFENIANIVKKWISFKDGQVSVYSLSFLEGDNLLLG